MISGVRNKTTTERQVGEFALLLHDSADALLEGVAKLNMCSYWNDKVQRTASKLRKQAVGLGHALYEPDEKAFVSLEATLKKLKAM